MRQMSGVYNEIAVFGSLGYRYCRATCSKVNCLGANNYEIVAIGLKGLNRI